MALFRITDDDLQAIPTTTLATERMKERDDLQRLLRGNPEAIESGLFILTEEFSYWEDSSRRIDLLGLDGDGRLVVVELKRDESGGFMDLQAVRYASMIANITSEQLTAALKPQEAERFKAEIARRTGGDDEFVVNSAYPRIILIAADFSTELTTSVLWLNDSGLEVTCIRARPYRVDGANLVLDIETVIPLPQESIYRVQLRQQRAEELEKVKTSRRERSLRILERAELVKPGTVIVIDHRKVENGVMIDLAEPKYRARFAESLSGHKNVVWDADGMTYSLSALTEKLRDEHAVGLPGGSLNGYWYWRLETDPSLSLSELADFHLRL